jgi:hypothetical protein
VRGSIHERGIIYNADNLCSSTSESDGEGESDTSVVSQTRSCPNMFTTYLVFFLEGRKEAKITCLRILSHALQEILRFYVSIAHQGMETHGVHAGPRPRVSYQPVRMHIAQSRGMECMQVLGLVSPYQSFRITQGRGMEHIQVIGLVSAYRFSRM